MSTIDFKSFETREALAEGLAQAVVDAIDASLLKHGKAAIALSGGRTPALFFDKLSARRLPWADVIVTLVDERWVPETSERSNAALLRQHLLKGAASAAEFLPLWRPLPTPEDGLDAVEAAVADLPLPFSAVVLGMGDDGHTASFFPGGDRLAAATDPAGARLVDSMRAPAAGEPRITLTLPVLLAADRLFLHMEGQGKKGVFDAALAGRDVGEMPVRSVLHSGRAVDVVWCP
ncbi:6-phosphogluconolactonase [Oryzibacter oryziterrae]|uniref:6-phosphogluconolactonase n=1 Tax=Oryzibacter oryziterrae TaxID=2766474 RepID=UPI001F030886|nr:6-phosphogluconolactonase [Oryzibacter oryziterrae]